MHYREGTITEESPAPGVRLFMKQTVNVTKTLAALDSPGGALSDVLKEQADTRPRG